MTQDTLTKDIEIGREGAVMSAAFARPQKKNAITGAMYEALIEAFDTAERDPEIGALVMSGKGGVFTAGNDIGDFLAVALHETGEFPAWRFVSKVAEFEKPLIAAIDGLAIGVGTTLCFHCDLVYAAPTARFQMPFVNLGLLIGHNNWAGLCPRGRLLCYWRRRQRFGRARNGVGLCRELPCCSPEPFERPPPPPPPPPPTNARARARPYQRYPASERADGACHEQGGGALGQAPRGPPRDAPPYARRS